MAGRGSRLRPHTLTIPKPLIPIAGKTIVERLVENIVSICKKTVSEISFIIGDFGEETEIELIKIAEKLGAKGTICYQKEPLGTAHAILCAKKALNGNVVVAFADTLFKANFSLEDDSDGIIWVKEIEDPSAFGVVRLNEKNIVTEFVEKPKNPVSNLAIIGIYYFKSGERLRKELQYLIDKNIKDKGEFQLTSALENMKKSGAQFIPGKVDEWLDCGNKDAVLNTNKFLLDNQKTKTPARLQEKIIESKIIQPCCFGKNVTIYNSIIGPNVTIGDNNTIENCKISNTLIQNKNIIKNAHIVDSMLGSHIEYIESINSKEHEVSIGDFTKIKK